MIQISRPLPAGMPICLQGHHPHLVESRGAPRGHRSGDPCPTQWHVQCHPCRLSTAPAPSPSPGVALLRWRATPGLAPVQLQLVPARKCVAAAHVA